ncbi:MAG TPA: hypothetical protein VGJ02_04140 [Pyrinomonadaceae bacterium]
MISAESIEAIIAQYDKFGWRLRRVLLTRELRDRLGHAAEEMFGNAEMVDSDIDTAWFSRPSPEHGVAWEIRRLDDFPFALVEVIDIDADPDTIEEVRASLESDLRDRIGNPVPGH